MHPSLLKPIQLRLLGEFDVSIADVSGTRDITYNKPKLLLALLALANGKPLSRMELANMLWPDESRDGRANLRHALFVLRRLFEKVPEVWLNTASTLALDPKLIMVDVLAVTGAAGYQALTLEERLAYDRGRLLEYSEFPETSAFANWHTSWQSRIEREISEGRNALLSRLREQGRHAEALDHAKQWVQMHPDDESAHRHLIRLLWDSGSRDAAILAYQDCRNLMRERFDSEPSEETRALMERVSPPAAPVARIPSEPRQYRPLAVLALTLSPDDMGLPPEQLLDGMQMARRHLLDMARKEGNEVQLGLANNMAMVFGYPVLTERPAHAAARLACAIRELNLPPGVRVGMGVHADISFVHSDESADGGWVTQVAVQLSFLAEAGEILVSAPARERLMDQFSVRAEKRHGRDLCVLEAQLEATSVHRMFGRIREFDTLVRVWARMPVAHPPTAMMVRGEPGIGKSLLAGVMAEYVKRTGGEVCMLACQEGHGDTPFHSVREYLLRRLSLEWATTAGMELTEASDLPGRTVEMLCKRMGVNEAALPGVKRVLFPEASDGDVAAVVAPDAPRAALVEALAAILAHHDQPDLPRLLIWEDLHWADRSSVAVVEALMQTTQRAPMMLLTTAREEFARTWPAHDLRLSPLDPQAMAELVVHRSRGHRLPPKLRVRIVEGAEGIPLYAEEMVRQVALGTEVGVTPVIGDLVAARLSAIGAAERQLIQFAAVAGSLDDALLTRAALSAGLSRRDIPRLLSELHERGLIDDRIPAKFRHELIRVAIYRTLSPMERRRQHALVAQYLMSLDPREKPVEPAYIARHLDQAQHPDAAQWWRAGMREALAQSAVSEASALGEYALAAVAYIDDAARRREAELNCQLLRGALYTALKGGGARETSQAYARTAELSNGDDSPQIQFQRLWGEWTVAICTRPHLESLQIAGRMHRYAEQTADGLHLGWAQYAYGYSRLWLGDAANAERWLQASVQTLNAQPNHSLRFAFCGADGVSLGKVMLGLAVTLQGREQEGLAHVRDALERAEALNHLSSQVMCLNMIAKLHWLRGDEAATRESAERLAYLAGQADFLIWRVLAQGWAGWAQALEGDSTAIASIEAAVQACSQDLPLLQSNLELLLAQALLAWDRDDEAIASIERAGALMEQFGTESLRGEYLRLLGDSWEKRGDGARAVACWRRALTESRRLGLSLSARRAEARIWGDAAYAA